MKMNDTKSFGLLDNCLGSNVIHERGSRHACMHGLPCFLFRMWLTRNSQFPSWLMSGRGTLKIHEPLLYSLFDTWASNRSIYIYILSKMIIKNPYQQMRAILLLFFYNNFFLFLK